MCSWIACDTSYGCWRIFSATSCVAESTCSTSAFVSPVAVPRTPRYRNASVARKGCSAAEPTCIALVSSSRADANA
eukprot:2413215-Rhodomonas_salina.1